MQKTRYSRYLKSLFILADIALLWGIFYFFIQPKIGIEHFFLENYSFFMLLICSCWGLISGYSMLYQVPRTLTYTLHLERILKHLILFILLVFVLKKLSVQIEFSIPFYLFSISLSIIFVGFKSFLFIALKYYRALGKNHRNVMFLLEGPFSDLLKNTIKHRKDYGYKIFKYPYSIENSQKLVDFWIENGIDTVFLPAEPQWDKNHLDLICKLAETHQVSLNFIPNILGKYLTQYQLQYFEALPVLVPSKYPLSLISNRIIKRTIDLVLSIGFILAIGLWLYPLIALCIWYSSGRPVFFVQDRYGYRNQSFKCFKFRTMEACKNNPSQKRVTKIGKFLRITSLDETPQFINVLLGQMSVVGPRPHMLSIDNLYKQKIEDYDMRSLVKPGITGLSQISGLRGDGKDVNIRMRQRLITDIFYIRNWSLSMDIAIIFKTLLIMIKGDRNAL